MWALLLAVQLRALGEDDYLLTKYDPVTSYVSTEGSYCAGKNIHVLDHPLTRVAQHSCVTKCGPGSFCEKEPAHASCAACDGYIKAYDTAEDATDVACLAEEDCQELCTSLPECHSLDVAVDQLYQKRCYLNTIECDPEVTDDATDVACLAEEDCQELCTSLPECHSLDVAVDQLYQKRCYLNTIECDPEVTETYAVDPNYRLTVKHVNVNPDAMGCEMGAGARISLDRKSIRAPARQLKPKRGKTPEPTPAPTFAPTPAPTPDVVLLYGDPYNVRGIYNKITAELYEKIGGTARVSWHTSKCGWVVEESLNRRLQRTSPCADADAAAAAAFGVPEDEDAGVCASVVFSPDYCRTSALLAALCANACGLEAERCAGDDDAAAAEMLQLMGAVGEASCAHPAIRRHCGSPVARAVCPDACLRAEGTVAPREMRKWPQNFTAVFRRALRERNRFEAGRQLGVNAAKTFFEVYYTYKPNLAPNSPSACALTPTPDSLATDKLYDAISLASPAEQTWDQTCGVLEGVYYTLPKRYCPHNNIRTTDATATPTLYSARCASKCGPHGELVGIAAGTGFCDGYEPEYQLDSNALCLPRAECEALCAATADCSSFDMHVSKPRCFLNFGTYCLPGFNPKIYEASDDYDFVYSSTGAVRYSTAEDSTCTEGPLNVASDPRHCDNNCGPPDMNWLAALNGRAENLKDKYFKVDDSPTGYFVPGRTTTKMMIGGKPVLVSIVHGSTISIGTVDVDSHKTYFGDLMALPFTLSSKKHKWGHHYNYPPVAVSETEIVVFAEYPGQGIGMAKGTVNPYALTVAFGAPSFIPHTYFNATGVYLMGAVAKEEDLFLSVAVRRFHDGCVSVSGSTLPACSNPSKHELHFVKYVSQTWSSDLIYDTVDGTKLQETCGFTYYSPTSESYSYSYSDDSRMLQEEEAGNDYYYVPAWRDYDTKEERDAWVLGGLLGDGVVFRSKVVKTDHAVALAFAVGQGGHGFKVYLVDETAPCGFKAPFHVNSTELAPCKQLKTSALPGSDIVFFWCRDRKAVLCNVVTGACGPHYADYGTLTLEGELDTAGGDIDCPTATLCVISSQDKVVQFLTIEPATMTITGVYTDTALKYHDEYDGDIWKFHYYYSLDTLNTNSAQLFRKANDDLTSDVVAISKDHVFVGLQYAPIDSNVSGVFSNIQTDYPVGASPCAFGLNACTDNKMSMGAMHGVLLWDKGTTWSFKSDAPGCDYYRLTLNNPEVNITDFDICGGRDVCEAACSDNANCAAFAFVPKSSMCNLYGPVCTTSTEAGSKLVTVAETAKCKITVAGAAFPHDVACTYDDDAFVMTTCALSGEYFKDSSTAYSTPSNSSKIYVDATQPCLGWVLGTNTATPAMITLTTYTNAPQAIVDLYAAKLVASDASYSAWGATTCDMLCTTPPCPIDSVAGVPSEWSCTSAALQALCPEQCLPTESAVVADQAVTYHVVSPELPYELSAGWLEYDNLFPPAEQNNATTCATACDCTGIKKKQACTTDEVLLYFCFDSCRKGGATEPPYEQTKLEFLDGSATFEMLYRTFPNGTCAEDVVVPPFGYATPDIELIKKPIYPATVPDNPALSMDKVCNTLGDLGSCPALTTCVMAPAEQAGQVAIIRGDVPKTAWVSKLPAAKRTALLRSKQWNDIDMNGKFPKMVFSETRSDAFIRKELYPYFKEIFLPVPGHNRIRFYGTQAGNVPSPAAPGTYPSALDKSFNVLPGISSILVTVTPPVDAVTLEELGRVYRGPPGYEGLISDIFRIEAFDYDDNPSEQLIEFEMHISDAICTVIGIEPASGSKQWACNPQPQVLVWTPDSDVAQRLTDIPGGRVYLSTIPDAKGFNWWVILAPPGYAQADFAVTTDVDECLEGKDDCQSADEGGMCTNTEGSYYCSCLSGYKGTDGTPPRTPLPKGVQCVLAKYIAADTQFLVVPEDDVEYGWKVAEVLVFEDYDPAIDACVGMCGGKDAQLSPDCHYGVPILGKSGGNTPNTYVQSLSSPGTYPGKNQGALKDSNAESEWWTKDLTLSRAAGTGAYIAFSVPAAVTVGCIQLRMPCTKAQPSMFTGFRAKKGNVPFSAAYTDGNVPFVEAGEPSWQASVTKSRGADQSVVSLQLPCGIKDAQYFGEMFVDFTEVPFPCACKQLCLDTVAEGCRTWKWYEETQHCFLQKSVFAGADGDSEQPDGQALKVDRASVRPSFEEGTGWWKLPFATGWPGWWTGDTGPLVMGFTTDPKPVVAGSPFSLTLTGSAFPLDDSLENNLGARQRVKIVAPDEPCSTSVPPAFLSGIGCTNAVTCSPRPTEFNRMSATWTGLSFASAKEETGYKVCWCASDCWHTGNWQEAPGRLVVSPSAYSWGFEGTWGALTVDSFGGTGLTLRVSRPAFSSIADKADWKMKLVSAEYDCDTLPPTWLACPDTGCGAGLTGSEDEYNNTVGLNLGPDEAVFYLTSDAAVVAGHYIVCLSEAAAADFIGIPSAKERYLTVGSPGAAHPRGPFHHQRFSARAGTATTIGVKGYQMYLPNAGSVALVNGSVCSSGAVGVRATLSGVTAKSTDEEYFFSGTLPDDLLGEYAVCHCKDPAYTVEEGKMFSSLLAPAASFQDDVCSTKCNYGCLGDRCFCEGGSFLGTATELCLSGTLCREACDATAGCTGYSTHATLPRCFLSGGAATTADVKYESWTKAGGTCAVDSDFLTTTAAGEADGNLGKITVTAKPVVGVDYVVTPGEKASIEVTGTDLDVMKDRIMVIDCYGTCGVSEPSPSASIPAVNGYKEFYPVNALIDRPSVMMRFAPEYPVNPPADYAPFSMTKSKYCPGNKLPIVENTLSAGHRCFQKCYGSETCTDESCFCGGFFPGYDTADSSAICLNQQQCEWLCAQTAGCHSIDMHKSKDRCFLNTEVCDVLHESADYNLLVKNVDDNTRRLQEMGRQLTAAQVRELLAAKDPGISWDSILRFRDIEFTSGGKFKLCFCDSALLGSADAICDGPEDYKIEIGEIHATGLQCLLSNPKMTRGVCEPQLFGGLRCYDDEAPAVVVPTEYLGVPDPDNFEASALTQSFISFCQYAPLEEVKEFKFCTQYRVFEPLQMIPMSSAR